MDWMPKSVWGRNFVVALIGAAVAGVFSLLPIGYDFLTRRAASLTYAIIEGPILPAEGEYKRIYVVQVRNVGSKEANSVFVQVNLTDGKIEQVSLQSTPGLKPKATLLPSLYEVELAVLNQGEFLDISLLLTVNDPDIKPDITVRGIGLIAEEKKQKTGTKGIVEPIALLTAMSATIGAFVVFSFALRRTKLSVFVYEDQRLDNISYILGRVGLSDLAQIVRFKESDVTYLGIADLLLTRGLTAPSVERNVYSTALKCLLLITWMQDISREIVRRGIMILDEDKYNEARVADIEGRCEDIGNTIQLREAIDTLISEESISA